MCRAEVRGVSLGCNSMCMCVHACGVCMCLLFHLQVRRREHAEAWAGQLRRMLREGGELERRLRVQRGGQSKRIKKGAQEAAGLGVLKKRRSKQEGRPGDSERQVVSRRVQHWPRQHQANVRTSRYVHGIWVSRFKSRISWAQVRFELDIAYCSSHVGRHLNQL